MFGLGLLPQWQRTASLLSPTSCAWRGRSFRPRIKWVSSRKRRQKLRLAEADPETHPGTLRRLREQAARPDTELLRYLKENKVHKAVTTADRRQLWYDLHYKKYAPMFLGQFLPRMQLWSAALEPSQLPPPRLPEVALAGRSNSGKSTLANYLCGRHSAGVRRLPGSTKELVFWKIGRPAQLALVDLPGYGFAHAPQETRLQWTDLMLWYLRSRRNLRLVLVMLDARQGLKPSDKEFIAYLERHGVSWRAVVTKADQVTAKDLARRLTVVKDEMKGYYRMTGEPMPVSALKRRGMDQLRQLLANYKVQKEVVKEGISKRVYDLLEQRRILRSERSRRRRERKREAEEAKAAAAAEASGQEADGEPNDAEALDDQDVPLAGKPSRGAPSLHELIGLHSLPWLKDGQSAAESSSDERTTAAANPSEPQVAVAHYSLDDRDSRRVDDLMRGLFPELPALPAAADGVQAQHSEVIQHQQERLDDDPKHWLGMAQLDLGVVGSDEEGNSDSDDDDSVPLPPVRRFDAPPARMSRSPILNAAAAGSVAGRSCASAFPATSPDAHSTSSSFPTWSVKGSPADRGSQRGSTSVNSKAGSSSSDHQVASLRSGWGRPPPSKDQMYDEDDIVMPGEQQAAWRHSVTPPPVGQPGKLLEEARKRYEREWAMELADIDGQRKSAADAGSEMAATVRVDLIPPSQLPPKKKSSRAEDAADTGGRKPKKVLPWYITRHGLRHVPRGGRPKWRVLGRPPAKILKERKDVDVARAFGKKDKPRRKTNLGSGLTYDEAKDYWLGWAHRTRRTGRAYESESPRKEDVDAIFEAREQRRAWRQRSMKPRQPGKRSLPRSPEQD